MGFRISVILERLVTRYNRTHQILISTIELTRQNYSEWHEVMELSTTGNLSHTTESRWVKVFEVSVNWFLTPGHYANFCKFWESWINPSEDFLARAEYWLKNMSSSDLILCDNASNSMFTSRYNGSIRDGSLRERELLIVTLLIIVPNQNGAIIMINVHFV